MTGRTSPKFSKQYLPELPEEVAAIPVLPYPFELSLNKLLRCSVQIRLFTIEKFPFNPDEPLWEGVFSKDIYPPNIDVTTSFISIQLMKYLVPWMLSENHQKALVNQVAYLRVLDPNIDERTLYFRFKNMFAVTYKFAPDGKPDINWRKIIGFIGYMTGMCSIIYQNNKPDRMVSVLNMAAAMFRMHKFENWLFKNGGVGYIPLPIMKEVWANTTDEPPPKAPLAQSAKALQLEDQLTHLSLQGQRKEEVKREGKPRTYTM